MSVTELPEGDLTCRVMVELVTDYVEGALDEAIRARFEAHLESCPPCLVFLEQMRATVALVGEVPAAEVDGLDPEVRDHLLAAFRRAAR